MCLALKTAVKCLDFTGKEFSLTISSKVKLTGKNTNIFIERESRDIITEAIKRT